MARSYSDPTQNTSLNAAITAARQGSDSIVTPPQQSFDTPAMEGSMQQFLSENLGAYVIIEFLIGTQTLTRKAGILYAVGTSVVTLYEEISQTFVTCDIFSVKFVTFYLPGRRPWMVNNPLFGQGDMAQGGMGQMGGNQSMGQAPFGAGTDMGIGSGTPFSGAAPGFAPPMDSADAAWG